MSFKVGKTKGVVEYATKALISLGERLCLSCEQQNELSRLFIKSLEVNAKKIKISMNESLVMSCDESRYVLDLFEKLLINNVELNGLSHVQTALNLVKQGDNVLLVSNHTSGADSLVLDYVVNQYFQNAAHNWTYMAGHVVNVFVLPLTLVAALNRIQIFSKKYCQLACEVEKRSMQIQNMKSIKTLRKKSNEGGQFIVLYPEGRRGDKLNRGEEATACIPLAMSSSNKNLWILPSYVEATNILPATHSKNEFNEFLEVCKIGDATLKFSTPINWKEFKVEELEKKERNREIVHKMMLYISKLAPIANKGAYA